MYDGDDVMKTTSIVQSIDDIKGYDERSLFNYVSNITNSAISTDEIVEIIAYELVSN